MTTTTISLDNLIAPPVQGIIGNACESPDYTESSSTVDGDMADSDSDSEERHHYDHATDVRLRRMASKLGKTQPGTQEEKAARLRFEQALAEHQQYRAKQRAIYLERRSQGLVLSDGSNTIGKDGVSVGPRKARKILHDKEVKGHPLTEKQRRFFGARASRSRDDKQ
jgi:hypothetical protein